MIEVKNTNLKITAKILIFSLAFGLLGVLVSPVMHILYMDKFASLDKDWVISLPILCIYGYIMGVLCAVCFLMKKYIKYELFLSFSIFIFIIIGLANFNFSFGGNYKYDLNSKIPIFAYNLIVLCTIACPRKQ